MNGSSIDNDDRYIKLRWNGRWGRENVASHGRSFLISLECGLWRDQIAIIYRVVGELTPKHICTNDVNICGEFANYHTNLKTEWTVPKYNRYVVFGLGFCGWWYDRKIHSYLIKILKNWSAQRDDATKIHFQTQQISNMLILANGRFEHIGRLHVNGVLLGLLCFSQSSVVTIIIGSLALPTMLIKSVLLYQWCSRMSPVLHNYLLLFDSQNIIWNIK